MCDWQTPLRQVVCDECSSTDGADHALSYSERVEAIPRSMQLADRRTGVQP